MVKPAFAAVEGCILVVCLEAVGVEIYGCFELFALHRPGIVSILGEDSALNLGNGKSFKIHNSSCHSVADQPDKGVSRWKRVFLDFFY